MKQVKTRYDQLTNEEKAAFSTYLTSEGEELDKIYEEYLAKGVNFLKVSAHYYNELRKLTSNEEDTYFTGI